MLDKRFLIHWGAVFVTLMAYGFIVYNLLLGDYLASSMSPDLMRPEDEQLAQWMAIGTALMAYAFVRIFRHNGLDKGISEGIGFGLLMGVFWGSVEFINYAMMPISLDLALVSFLVDVGMFVTSGFVLGVLSSKHSS